LIISTLVLNWRYVTDNRGETIGLLDSRSSYITDLNSFADSEIESEVSKFESEDNFSELDSRNSILNKNDVELVYAREMSIRASSIYKKRTVSGQLQEPKLIKKMSCKLEETRPFTMRN
jgi:hypothetical protein